jgi:hypothetical protein
MEMNRERKRSGLLAAAKQLSRITTAKPGILAKNIIARTNGIVYLKLISCETSTGPTAIIAISRPRTTICQGYSKMLTGEVTNLPIRKDSTLFSNPGSNEKNEPVNIFDQNKHATQKTATQPNQQLRTF